MQSLKPAAIKIVLFLGVCLVLVPTTIIFYPFLKSGYLQLSGKTSLMFLDVTDSAGMKRHHAGPAWLSSFSVSVVDYDNDGDVDIFVNNHERNRPYFYRNNGNGTFSETHEAIGLLENKIGPVFGSPVFDDKSSGFFIWLDPVTAINGTWHLRWINQDKLPTPVSGELITNTKLADVHSVNLTSKDRIKVDEDTINLDASADRSMRGIDFKSTFPESTIQFDLRINGNRDIHHIFIGPQNVNPTTAPFSLSLGDRHAATWGDYNNDGYPDLFVPRGAMVGEFKPPHGAKHDELFINNSNFHLENVIEDSGIKNDYGRGRDAQWVDYDNDGLLDLYETNFEGKNLLFKNMGNGAFQDRSKESGLDFFERAHFLWTDFDNDGYPDVFFTNPDGLFLNKGNGTFVDATADSGINVTHTYKNIKDAYFWGSGASAADYDNDGDLDLFVASGKGGGKSRLFEKQHGVFVDVTDKAGLADLRDVTEAIWGDFDNDGHVDLYTIGADPASNRLFRNNGDRIFTDETDKRNLSLLNRLEWEVSTRAGGVATWVDYDNDGFLDLFLATRRIKNVGQNNLFLLTNNLNSAPQNAMSANGQSSTSLTKLMDSLMATAHKYMEGKIPGTHFLLRNTGNGNHWINIRLIGTRSNRDGYGAKVSVTTDDMMQFQEAGVSGKMLYAQNDVPLHFGLGKADTVKEIKVVWPSGKQQIITGVAANQVERIKEPLK